MDKGRFTDIRIRQVGESEMPTVRGWLDDPLFRSEFLPFGRDRDIVVTEKQKGIAHGTEEATYFAIERTSDSKLIGRALLLQSPLLRLP
jgi:hypothetical protein